METLQRTANRGSISTGYDIDNSAAFGGANGIQFNPSSDGNRRTWTMSLWLKRSELSTETTIFGAQNTAMVLMDPDWFRFHLNTGSTTYYFDTENGGPVYRDTSAWYNFVFQCDTTQGTAADRAKLWVNGEAVTNTNSNVIPQNTEFQLNNNTVNFNVGYFYAGNEQLDGYLADVHFTDGVANDPTEFGEFDNDSGVWKPKAYTGSYGTNGFYLEFKESAASATGIGKDTSGNGHNFSTGGTYPSQATDTPTNNFCTWSPLWVYANSTNRVISEGGTKITGTGAWGGSKGSIGVTNGKWYWENKASGNDTIVGWQTDEGVALTGSSHDILSTMALYEAGNYIWLKDSTSGRNDTACSGTYAGSQVVGFALDLDSSPQTATFYRNGSAIASNVNIDGLSGKTIFPFIDQYNQSTESNFGGYTSISNAHTNTDENGYGSFIYAPPSGYYALCTKNLAEYG